MSFIGPGNEPRIYQTPDASPIEEFAAEELRAYLYRITGRTLAISTDQRPSEPHIFLGTTETFNARRGADETHAMEALQAPEAFRIKVGGGSLSLVGQGPAGVLAAVYQLLEYLGARWYEPGDRGEQVPKLERVELGKSERKVEPLLSTRGLVGVASREGIDWMGKNRLNCLVLPYATFRDVPDMVREETVKRGIRVEILSSALHDWVQAGDGILDDPECLALRNGARARRDGDAPPSLCGTSRKVREAAADGVLRFFEEHSWVEGIAFDFREDLGRCECRGCAKNRNLDNREVPAVNSETGEFRDKTPLMSDAAWDLFGAILSQLGSLKARKQIRLLGVGETFYAPRSTRFDKDAGCLLQLDARCYRHVLNSTECLPNQCLWHPLEMWTKRVKGHIVIYDHYGGPEDFVGMLFPAVRLLGTEILILYDLGVDGIVTDVRWDSSTLNALNLWTFAKQTWSGDGTVDPALDDFFPQYFGEASREMREYFRVWYFRWLGLEGCFLGRGMDILRLLGLKEFTAAQDLLETGMNAAKLNGSVRKRLRRESAFLHLSGHVWNFLHSVFRTASFHQSGIEDEDGGPEDLLEERRAALLSFADSLDQAGERAIRKAVEEWPAIITRALSAEPGQGHAP